MTVARFYEESKHEEGGVLPGVPLADIDEETFNAYPEWLQQSIDALPFYRKSKPESAPRKRADSEKET